MQDNLFGESAPISQPVIRNRFEPAGTNPLLSVFGEGKPGQKCKGCRHLVCRTLDKNNVYKCALRNNNNSSNTDHKVNFQSCSRYEAKADMQPVDKGEFNPKESQLTKIRELLLAGKKLTVQSVLRLVHTQELRTYIPMLRREGLEIVAEWKTKGDKRFKEYYLKTA